MDKYCKCGNKLSYSDINTKKTECVTCRKEAKFRAKEKEIYGKLIAIDKYDVISVEKSDTLGYACTLKCRKCGTVKTIGNKSALKPDNKCISCEVYLDRSVDKYMENLQPRELTFDSPIIDEKCGIYKITIGDKFYIGSSRNLVSRFRSHRTNMRNNLSNIKILKALDKCSHVVIEIVEYCTDDNVVEREQHYIDSMVPSLNMYNIAVNSENSKIAMTKNLQDCDLKLGDEDIDSINIVKELLKVKDSGYVAEKLGTKKSKIDAILHGDRARWLEHFMPIEYKRLLATKGSQTSYNEIRTILCDLINEMTPEEVAEKNNRELGTILVIRRRDAEYCKRLYEVDEVIRKLYEIIEIQKG